MAKGSLAFGLAAFLVGAVLLTLLGLGEASGNAAGLLFWMLLAVLAVAYRLSSTANHEEHH